MNEKTTRKLSANDGQTTVPDGATVPRQGKKIGFWRSLQSQCVQLFDKQRFRALVYTLCGGLAIILILLIGLSDRPTVVAAQTPPAAVDQTSTPVPETSATLTRCRVNYYLTALTDFDFVEGTFYAVVWLSGNCNKPDAPSTDALYFPTAKSYEMPIKETVKGVGEGSYWYANLRGTFRKNWDMQNFPFDRHTLNIPFLVSYPDATQFLFEADKKNSGIHDAILLQDGWRIASYSVDAGITQYQTNFADPRATVDKIAQANVNMTIEIERTSNLSFIKLVGGVYIAFAVCAVCFLLDASNSELYTGMLGLLVGALFAVFVNLQAAGATLGTAETLTMIDQIHIITMFYILMAMAMETLFFLGHQSEWSIHMTKIEHICEIGFVASYAIVNIVIIIAGHNYG